jgi:hypothetical protein
MAFNKNSLNLQALNETTMLLPVPGVSMKENQARRGVLFLRTISHNLIFLQSLNRPSIARADRIFSPEVYRSCVDFTKTTFASLNVDPAPSVQPDRMAFLNPALCANTQRKADQKEPTCQNTANLICSSCKIVQV